MSFELLKENTISGSRPPQKEVKEVRKVEEVLETEEGKGGPLSASEMIPAAPALENQRVSAEVKDPR